MPISTKPRQIALLTCSQFPGLTSDDLLLAAELGRRGAEAVPLIWDDPAADWDRFDALVLRSCWDYHHRIDEFSAWLERRAGEGARLWNPADLVRWNLHKSYLETLADAGVPVVPTVRQPQGKAGNLAEILRAHGWERAVVKPAVSASAHQTWLVRAEEAAASQPSFEELAAEVDVLVQRFEPAVQVQGEWSLVFFGGAYSHAMLKRPKSGDFRVQEALGGSSTPATPPPALVEQASSILGQLRATPLYARVDGIDLGGTLTLMELELIEPFLYLGSHPEAPARMADALERLAA